MDINSALEQEVIEKAIRNLFLGLEPIYTKLSNPQSVALTESE